VTTSSAQPVYSITLNDTIDLSGIIAQDISTAIDTITITNSTLPSVNAVYTSSSIGSSGTITINDVTSGFTNNWISEEEWINAFPAWDRIQDMCNEYPGLKIAFEKFKTTYKLVKDDYDTPKDKRKTP
jgi:hypothetical protein